MIDESGLTLSQMILGAPSNSLPLTGKTVLVTGAARRLGRVFALAAARAGGDVILHHGHSEREAAEVQTEISNLGRRAWVVSADLADASQVEELYADCMQWGPIYALVNSAATFDPAGIDETGIETWQQTLAVNLTAPFLLSQAFARALPAGHSGRIVNVLDWRALRPGTDHFAYTISKAALAAMTKSMALGYAPEISVNGLALGAVLPPSDGNLDPTLLQSIPVHRWAKLEEVEHALIFLLCGPTYLTGEILYLDGGRHLV
jgi:NAD(P)-dependent dehydrogenase (short-subunit alcohol dehydrogenase family)